MMKPYTFTHDGVNYTTGATLKMWQMEKLTALLHESRKKLFTDMTTKPDGSTDIQLLLKVTVNLADVMSDLLQKGVMSEFCAIIAAPTGKIEQTLEQRTALFAELDYDHAEEIITFFFATGSFAKLIMPKYLREAAPQVLPGSREKSTKSPS